MPRIVLKIGPIAVSIHTNEPAWHPLLKERYKSFLIKKPLKAIASIELKTAEERTGKRQLTVKSTLDGHEISRNDFHSTSDMYFKRTSLSCLPNVYSFDSWLRVFITAAYSTRGMVLVHGASTGFRRKAYLFAGVSGRGKSTITRKLGIDAALSDELTLLSTKGKKVFAHSTPFWGELARPETAGPVSLPLGRIYYLKHGPKLSDRSLTPAGSFAYFMTTILFFSTDAGSVNGMLDTAVNIIKHTGAATLAFSLKTGREQICRLLEERLS